jgi:hypothetical protein
MALPRLLEEAASRMQEASLRMERAREKRATVKSNQDWLVALTDYAIALGDVQRFANESVHEKLHELAGHVGLKSFPSDRVPSTGNS